MKTSPPKAKPERVCPQPVRLSTGTGEMLAFSSAAAAIAYLTRNGAFDITRI